jgi:hypothetical protein
MHNKTGPSNALSKKWRQQKWRQNMLQEDQEDQYATKQGLVMHFQKQKPHRANLHNANVNQPNMYLGEIM